MFQGSVKSTGYPLPVSPSLPLPCVTVCHHVSTGLYLLSSHFNGYTPSSNTQVIYYSWALFTFHDMWTNIVYKWICTLQ